MTVDTSAVTSADLLTVGEALIRLSVPSGDLLADTRTLDVNVAGAESNVAVAVARMGFTARWLSRLTDNVWGQRIAHELGAYGVDCSGVDWTDADRVGSYYIEAGAQPRPTRIIYDRAYSAASRMSTDTFDLDQVKAVRLVHLTGITAALSDSCYDLVRALITRACQANVPVVFDVNFRALLWSAETCAEKLTPLIEQVDTLIISRADAAVVFGVQGTPNEILETLQKRFGAARIVLTLGEAGADALENGVHQSAAGYPTDIVDRIGAGDALAAGIICGLLRNDLALGLRYGVAMSALKLSLKGDLFRLTEREVKRLIESGIAERPLR